MQHCPSRISRGRPPPPAREPGLTRAGGLPPAPQPRPQDQLSTWTLPKRICFSAMGLRAPPPATSDPPKMDAAGPGWKDPLPGPSLPFPEAGSCHTQAHAPTHIPASSHKRSDTPESPAPVDSSSAPHCQASGYPNRWPTLPPNTLAV